jgi:hypothetical protein
MLFLKHRGLRALGTASLAAVALVACSGGSANDDLPLIRATLAVKSVSTGGVCESVPIRMTPKELIGKANKYANNRMMVAEIRMTGPTSENGAPMCNGTGETLPLAPGNWEFRAPLASGAATCMRNIQADGDLLITFIDGIDGCAGNGSAQNGMSLDGEMTMDAEQPADAMDTAPPPGG